VTNPVPVSLGFPFHMPPNPYKASCSSLVTPFPHLQEAWAALATRVWISPNNLKAAAVEDHLSKLSLGFWSFAELRNELTKVLSPSSYSLSHHTALTPMPNLFREPPSANPRRTLSSIDFLTSKTPGWDPLELFLLPMLSNSSLVH
jgi:hypothetical protein